MTDDPKTVVAGGYDVIAHAYLERHARFQVRDGWLRQLIERLPPATHVLDLGCGAGLPAARLLVDSGVDVIGVDASARQVELARKLVPEARIEQADMTAFSIPPASLHAVLALYSITHLPRAEHSGMLQRIAHWLKPGALFLANLGAQSLPNRYQNWLGTEMFFSHFDAGTNRRLVVEAGFEIERAEVLQQDDEDAQFLWVLARRKGGA